MNFTLLSAKPMITPLQFSPQNVCNNNNDNTDFYVPGILGTKQ
jgi:hypothetical protein